MGGLSKTFGPFLLRYRLPLVVMFHMALTFIGYYLALGLRFDFDQQFMVSPERLWEPALMLITARYGCYLLFNLNHGYWRYSSTHDLVRLVKAHALGSVIFVALVLVFRLDSFPRSVIFFEFALSLLLSGGSRLGVRLFSERFLSETMSELRGYTRDVVIIGAGDSGHLVVKNLLSQRRLQYTPVAILDDSERAHGTTVFGIPVYGTLASLEGCLQKMPSVAAVIIAIPSLSAIREQEISETCKRIGVAVKRLQSFEDIACADALSPKEGISIESVLEKEITIEHEGEIREALTGRRVLVTGAGGSIGSEIVRQLLNFRPAALVVLDNSEFNLFQLTRELQSVATQSVIHFVIGSVSDAPRLEAVFAKHRPDFVFHAAAYKHVPLMEDNCYEAFRNNVIGTRNVLDCSVRHRVERFVLISTDKAVQPSSVMGASKRIAELLVRSYASGRQGFLLNAAVVRFGNVINSSGSVIPVFKQQILSGGPLTVTHPDMERYFMSIREAVRLVLTAGILGDNGEVFVLDMGKPIKVVDVARKMLALYGRRDIDIVFTGIRPGEKLTEELTGHLETISRTAFSKVNRVSSDSSDSELVRVQEWVRMMERSLTSLAEAELKRKLLGFFDHGAKEPAKVTGTIEIERLSDAGRAPDIFMPGDLRRTAITDTLE